MFKAYGEFWKGYFNFKGRTTIAEYWWTILCNLIILTILGVLGFAAGIGANVFNVFSLKAGAAVSTLVISGLALLFEIVLIIPMLAMGVRRLRDAGLSLWFIIVFLFVGNASNGQYLWLMLIGVVASIAWLILTLRPTKSIE